MAIYVGVYLTLLLAGVIGKRVIKNKIKANIFVSLTALILILLVLCLRHPSMGIDLGYGSSTGYLASFEKLGGYSWKKIFSIENFRGYERGYILLNKLVYLIFPDQQFFLSVCAILSVTPVIYLIAKKSEDTLLSLITYMALPVFQLLFSGLRQNLAIGLCMLAFVMAKDKKPIKFLLLVIVAFFFHRSAFFFLLVYPLLNLQINKTARIISFFLIALTFIIRYELFSVLTKIFRPQALPDDNNAIMLFLLMCALYVFLSVFEQKEQTGYLNIFFLACVCQAFSGVYNTAMRLGYYFMLSLLFLVPSSINLISNQKERKFVYIVTVVLLIALGVYSLINSSWAGAYPYSFFWEA